MKAEIIQTRFGTSLQITAMSEADQQDLQAFMEATRRPRKPKLKILSSPDHKKYLTLGFKSFLSMRDFVNLPSLQDDTINYFLNLTPILIPENLQDATFSPITSVSILWTQMFICHDSNGSFFAFYIDTAENTKVFFGAIYFFSDIAEKAKRLAKILNA